MLRVVVLSVLLVSVLILSVVMLSVDIVSVMAPHLALLTFVEYFLFTTGQQVPNCKKKKIQLHSWMKCCKTFYGRTLQMFVIRWSACPRQAFPA